MTSGINTREMILEILLQINEEGEHSHIAIRNALSKYQFLPKQERAFITRVCEGTLEYRILIDYIINSFSKIPVDKICDSLKSQGVTVEPAPYLPYAKRISGYNHILALDAFIQGKILVQDVSSMLVAEIANPSRGDYVIDMCAAPGGKSLHMGDKMEGFGTVDARDISQYKVNLIEENIQRTGSINVQAKVQDATLFDVESECKADIVLADVPCSGYGVIGKKPEIKYRSTAQKEDELVILQRTILDKAAEYVKPRGVLIFSTCTIAKEENEENMMWFMNNHPFKLESIDDCIPEELHSETTALGYLQLLPGVHGTDGFFIAKFRRK